MRQATTLTHIRSWWGLIFKTHLFVRCTFTEHESLRTIVLISQTLNTSRSHLKSTLVDRKETMICVVTAPMKPSAKITLEYLRELTSQSHGWWLAMSQCVQNYSKKKALVGPILKFTNQITRFLSKKSWSPSRFQMVTRPNSFRQRTCVQESTSFGWLSAPEMAASSSLWNPSILSIPLVNLLS